MFSVQPLIVAAFLTQLVLVVGSCAKGSIPEDNISKDKHPKLYEAVVIHAEVVTRPLSFLPKYGWVGHSGVVVTLDIENGKKLLIHKLGCGTVVQKTEVMGTAKWEKILEKDCHKGKTVGELVEAAGKGYNIFIDNCHQTKNLIIKTAKRTMEQKSNLLI